MEFYLRRDGETSSLFDIVKPAKTSRCSAREGAGATGLKYFAAFSLTLTLSPGEREKQSRAFDFSKDFSANAIAGSSKRRRVVLPLPAGADWGEGERWRLFLRDIKSQ